MKQKTEEEVARQLFNRAVNVKFQDLIKEQIEYITELEAKLKLRERLIDEQRSHIEILKAELRKKKWWKLW